MRIIIFIKLWDNKLFIFRLWMAVALSVFSSSTQIIKLRAVIISDQLHFDLCFSQ